MKALIIVVALVLAGCGQKQASVQPKVAAPVRATVAPDLDALAADAKLVTANPQPEAIQPAVSVQDVPVSIKRGRAPKLDKPVFPFSAEELAYLQASLNWARAECLDSVADFKIAYVVAGGNQDLDVDVRDPRAGCPANEDVEKSIRARFAEGALDPLRVAAVKEAIAKRAAEIDAGRE